ncbi:UNVERIFIED_CONTAM: hypothetical protein FKN15_028456 [Acipenser sinensis]
MMRPKVEDPCHQKPERKPRVVPNPIPTSPTSSTPEPDTSTVPLDNATIPSAALQAPTGSDSPTRSTTPNSSSEELRQIKTEPGIAPQCTQHSTLSQPPSHPGHMTIHSSPPSRKLSPDNHAGIPKYKPEPWSNVFLV